MVFSMTNDKGILIKNIFHMLTYAFQVLKQSNYDEVASEEFENIQDLFAAILAKGIGQQLKQGLYREYITQHENLFVLRGKLDINGAINNKIQRKQQLSCEFDELSENNIFNRILKTTAFVLMGEKSVNSEHRKALKKVMLFFVGAESIDPSTIKWSTLRFQRNNQNYKMLMNICYFVLDGLLQTTEKGKYKMMNFSDEHMHKLFEKFVLEYYRHHHRYLSEVKAGQVKWFLDDDADDTVIKFLPVMQTDIMLRYKQKILIIDTKYYAKTMMQSQHENLKLHSNNLYQIFTYVKNQDSKHTGDVYGMLLYAKTGESITPDCEFPMGGNRISVKTLDLNTHFKEIAKQLDKIVESHFGHIEVPTYKAF